jgi:hypothetical protein
MLAAKKEDSSMSSRNPLTLALSIATLLASGAAQADDPTFPRGPDTHPLASNCSMGPFPQVAKAGPYNGHCDELTDGEKCFALVRGQLSARGALRPVHGDDGPRTEYCLEVFRKELLEETGR